MQRTRASKRLLTLILLYGIAGCGGEKSEAPSMQPAPSAEQETPEPAAAPTPAAQTAEPAGPATPDAEGTVRMTANDQMRFNATRIEVKAGEKVKIELKNVGQLPKEAMGHNLVVLKAGNDATAFATKAMNAKATDYVPADAQDQVIAHTKLLGPGESQTIEFDAPPPGSYPFLCSFPGHVALMNGQLVVQ